MATTSTLEQVKLFLRRTHSKLDAELQANIDACKADLEACGVIHAGEDDPLILNAIKLYCKSLDVDDPAKGALYLQRYDALKACLMMAEGYGWKEGEEAEA